MRAMHHAARPSLEPRLPVNDAAAPPVRSSGATRVLTALVALPVVVGAVWTGGYVFAAFVAIVCVLAQREFYALCRAAGTNPGERFGLVAGALLAVQALWAPALWLGVAAFVAYLCTVPFRDDRSHPVLDLAATAGGLVYPTLLLSALLPLRLDAAEHLDGARLGAGGEGFWLTLAVMCLVFATDTAAYYTGRAIGRRPLAPKVSPKKTLEGSAGGALGALGAAALFKHFALPSVPWGAVLAAALAAGVVSQLGDLAESRLKRAAGVKDSGTLLPGHGGFLDRFDAMLVAAPLAYAVFRLWLGW